MKKEIILYNIRSAHNVGSIFRTADGAGVSKIYLVGSTPTPIDRFGRVQDKIAKTSLGATASVVWDHVGDASHESREDTMTLIKRKQESGLAVVAVEQSSQSISLFDFNVPENVVYIFGYEIDGVPEEIIKASDTVVDIPMLGTKESLNVGVAAGIILYRQ